MTASRRRWRALALTAPLENLAADDGEDALAEVHRRGLDPVGSLVRRSSLEDVFLRLTGRTLVD